MKRLILIRHGECPGNAEGRFRGRFDFELNQAGLCQAHEVATALHHENFNYVYTSPLKRSSKTAEIIATSNTAKVISYPPINNISLGSWEGERKEDIKIRYPEEWKIWRKNPEALRMKDAENLKDVQNRALTGVHNLILKHAGETVVMVGHRAVLKPLIAGLLQMRSPWFWKIHLDNCSITTFDIFENDNPSFNKYANPIETITKKFKP